MPLPDEQIKALLKGTESVTLGPWVAPQNRHYGFYVERAVNSDADPIACDCNTEADAAHIARCDPGTIAELCTRLLSAEDRMKAAEEQASKLRMCVNCGKYAPVDHPRHEPLAECVEPETGLSACTFDMTPHEAWQHWSAKAHAIQARVKVLEEAARNIKPYLVWTVGPESPGHHPTMPSAVDTFLAALQEQSNATD
jgi:hypothetical protein